MAGAGDGFTSRVGDDIASGQDSPSGDGRGGEEKNAWGLASHIQSVAWDDQDFSDVVVSALGKVWETGTMRNEARARSRSRVLRLRSCATCAYTGF